MAELIVLRHAQASFGAGDAADYDALSELGHRQSAMAGEALRAAGWVPDRLITGTLRRQRETLASMGFDTPHDEHAGLNEYDFHDLLSARFGGEMPHDVRTDRKTHFRTLRDTILEWQRGGLPDAAESWAGFTSRVADALSFATQPGPRRVLAISSGGVIGQLVASVMGAPDAQMMALNLQVKNTSMTKFIFSEKGVTLHEFNAAPHFASAEGAEMLSYS